MAQPVSLFPPDQFPEISPIPTLYSLAVIHFFLKAALTLFKEGITEISKHLKNLSTH